MAKTLTYITAPTVFVEWYTTGRLGGSDSSGLHEAAIVRVKVEKQGESLIVVKKWTANQVPQVVDRIVGNEYNRLVEKYGKELVVSIYGNPHDGRLKFVMDRMHEAFTAGMDWSQIIELGNPNADFQDLSGGIPAPEGLKTNEDDDKRPSMSQIAKELASATDDGEPKGIDDVPEEKAIDGNLVQHLIEEGWLDPDALAIARIVATSGIKEVSDESLKALRNFAKADARKRVRQHLAAYAVARKIATQGA